MLKQSLQECRYVIQLPRLFVFTLWGMNVAKVVKVSMRKATPHLTMQVRYSGVRTWRVRCWLFMTFLKLAEWCYPGSVKVNWFWSNDETYFRK